MTLFLNSRPHLRLFSAIGDPEYAGYAMSKGAADFWVKSHIDFSKLHQMVAQYVALPTAA